MKLLAISGKLNSGKDTVYDLINKYAGNYYDRVRFAAKLKQMTAILIGCSHDELEDREFKEKSLGKHWNNLTPRVIMQQLGTEFGRGLFEDLWVVATVSSFHPDRNYTVVDCRFPNECNAIKKRGGIVIRVERDICNKPNAHISETALDDYGDFDYTLLNNGTLSELADEVNKMVKILGL